jgi:type II secretion system protein C
MSFLFSERYVVALNVMLVGLLAYFAVCSVRDIKTWRSVETVGPAPIHVTPRPVIAASRDSYSIIAKRDIFNSVQAKVMAPPPPVVAGDLSIRLAGTTHFTRSRPYAIIEDQRTARQSLYRQGDQIPDVGKLISVEKDRVIILHEGQKVAVEVPPDEYNGPGAMAGLGTSATASGLKPAPKAPVPKAAGVRQLGASEYQVDRSALNRNLHNLPELLTPNMIRGKTYGVAISHIQPGSVLEQMGLRDGDVIMKISGQALDDADKTMAMLNKVQPNQSISVELTRSGDVMLFNYDIR